MNVILPLARLSKQLLVKDVAQARCLNPTTLRNFHITSSCMKEIRVGHDTVSVQANYKYGPQEGEIAGVIYDLKTKKLFPDEETPNMLFKGVPYKELPIVNIKASPNNTIMNLTDYTGKVLALHSASMEGFKNARKGTNIAAQQTAISFSHVIKAKCTGVIRLRVKGLGPGRASSIKGLEMGGIEIVSITDTTGVSWCPPRPPKPRKL